MNGAPSSGANLRAHAPSLRILMVAPTSFFGHYGGHIRILEETRSLQARGHQIRIVTYFKGQNVPGLCIERTPPLPWRAEYEVGSSRHKFAFDAYLAFKVLQVGRRWRPHIVHGHMHEGALLGALVARPMRVPLVFDFQGSLTGEMLDHGFVEESGRGYQFWRWLEARIAHMPEAILTSSERGANLLRTEFSVPDDRIYPLPDCADLAHFAPNRLSAEEKGALRARLGIPDDRVVVAYLGLLADYQGTGHLIEAAAALQARGKPIHFLIMGYPNEDKYAALAQAHGVADYVTLTGRVNYREDAPGMLSLGDIAVSPKMSDTEGSGKVLNYMAMAQPVIAYESPVHREYLGGAGVYVPLGDVGALAAAIETLAADPGRRSALGSSLRERAARHFSWSRAASGIEKLYLHLLQQNSVRIPDAY